MPSKKRVLIVGAGIAGTTTAALLAREGIEVTLIEKSKSFISGMGICLPANATECLKKLNLIDIVCKNSFISNSWKILSESSKEITDFNFNTYFGPNKLFIATHRTVLHHALLSLENLEINFNLSISEILDNNANNVNVKFNNGTIEKFDLLVAADGIYSSIRQMICPEISIDYLGVACYRLVVPKPKNIDQVTFIFGSPGFLLMHPLSQESLYCGFVFPEKNKGRFTEKSFEKHIKTFFPSVRLPFQEGVQALPGWMETLSSTVFFKDRIVFIGDAGHGCATSLQQGAALAMEDSIILAECLKNISHIPEALYQFTKRREQRVNWVRQESNDCMRNLNQPLTEEQKTLRNEKIKTSGLNNFALWKKLFASSAFNY
jgi:2-polyprenyl-6-methoxyphenol hydroxylase-like FAD-dependent oxidoreductase